jgi:hypothetical protein
MNPNFVFPPPHSSPQTPTLSRAIIELFACGIAMAPRKRKQGAAMPDTPPVDPSSQLPFYGNYASVISGNDLLHLIQVCVLPSKELCSWRF